MGNRTYDVILVGGGVMGCSTAYSLSKADPTLDLGLFSPRRVLEGRPLSEGRLV